MLQSKIKRKSFTLIELIVAITIALLLMATGAFILNKSSGMGQVTSDAELLSTFIGRARNLAANPDDVNAIGYGVRKFGSGSAQNEFELYKQLVTGTTTTTIPLQDQRIKLTGSQITSPPAFAVLFTTPAGTYNGNLTATLSLVKKPATFKTIIIKKPGYVNVQ